MAEAGLTFDGAPFCETATYYAVHLARMEAELCENLVFTVTNRISLRSTEGINQIGNSIFRTQIANSYRLEGELDRNLAVNDKCLRCGW